MTTTKSLLLSNSVWWCRKAVTAAVVEPVLVVEPELVVKLCSECMAACRIQDRDRCGPQFFPRSWIEWVEWILSYNQPEMLDCWFYAREWLRQFFIVQARGRRRWSYLCVYICMDVSCMYIMYTYALYVYDSLLIDLHGCTLCEICIVATEIKSVRIGRPRSPPTSDISVNGNRN